jgi:hypothetical protein
MAVILVLIVGIMAYFVAKRRERGLEPKSEAPAPPIDARTLRRFVPVGTMPSDYVIPCPDCGWNTAVSREWLLANDRFVCPRCHAGTRLIKSEHGGPGTIVPEYEKYNAPPPLPDPITHTNFEDALCHLAKTYGSHPETHAHDEADGPAPELVPTERKKRGRPRKLTAATLASTQAPAGEAGRKHLSVLASELRIPATIRYARGHHAGIPRGIVILQAMGYYGPDGQLDVKSVRCICDHVKQFRAFRLDHITELIDGETGEIVPDALRWLDRKLAVLV